MKKLLRVSLVAVTLIAAQASAKELINKKIEISDNSKAGKIKVLKMKIKKYKDYLIQLPIDIQNAINSLNDYKNKGEQAEERTKNLIKTLRQCSERELDEMAQDACNDISEESVVDTINNYKREVEELIALADEQLKILKSKEKNIDIIKNALHALQDARDILEGR